MTAHPTRSASMGVVKIPAKCASARLIRGAMSRIANLSAYLLGQLTEMNAHLVEKRSSVTWRHQPAYRVSSESNFIFLKLIHVIR